MCWDSGDNVLLTKAVPVALPWGSVSKIENQPSTMLAASSCDRQGASADGNVVTASTEGSVRRSVVFAEGNFMVARGMTCGVGCGSGSRLQHELDPTCSEITRSGPQDCYQTEYCLCLHQIDTEIGSDKGINLLSQVPVVRHCGKPLADEIDVPKLNEER